MKEVLAKMESMQTKMQSKMDSMQAEISGINNSMQSEIRSIRSEISTSRYWISVLIAGIGVLITILKFVKL